MITPKRIALLAGLAAAAAAIVPATAAHAESSSPPPPPPNVQYIGLFHAKWILPPRGSSMYAASKAFAESAGYETVEFDDFSYPPHP
jgi:hypothetical protein